MWKHSRCVIDIYVTMTYTQSCIKSTVVWMEISSCKNYPKDGAVKAAWIITILKGRKQLIQESLHTFVTTSPLVWLINPSPVFNKINPNPVM